MSSVSSRREKLFKDLQQPRSTDAAPTFLPSVFLSSHRKPIGKTDSRCFTLYTELLSLQHHRCRSIIERYWSLICHVKSIRIREPTTQHSCRKLSRSGSRIKVKVLAVSPFQKHSTGHLKLVSCPHFPNFLRKYKGLSGNVIGEREIDYKKK